MLALSRLPGEIIRIGDDITVKVVRVRGQKVKLAIEVPREVGIHRQEIYEAIQKEKAAKGGVA